MTCAASLRLSRASHVIFDLDGVILDTEKLYTVIYADLAERFGKTFDWSIKREIIGTPGNEISKKIVALLDLPITAERFYELARDTEHVYKHAVSTIAGRFGRRYTPEIQGKVIGTVESESARIAVQEMRLPVAVGEFQLEFRRRAHDIFRTSPVPFVPGADILVKHLHKNKVPLAVATSSSHDSFVLKTSNHKDFFKLFSHVVCGGSDPDVKRGKPNPDIFLICASRFSDKPRPESCLVFEDAPSGVKAAIGAGMQVIMIPDENIPQELRKEAHVVIQNLEDAPLEKFGLPPLKRQ